MRRQARRHSLRKCGNSSTRYAFESDTWIRDSSAGVTAPPMVQILRGRELELKLRACSESRRRSGRSVFGRFDRRDLSVASTDLLNLRVPLGREALLLTAESPIDLRDLRRVCAPQLLHRRRLQNLLLRNLRVVKTSHLGDRGLLLVRQLSRRDAFFRILLPQPLHCQLVRRLWRAIVRHVFSLVRVISAPQRLHPASEFLGLEPFLARDRPRFRRLTPPRLLRRLGNQFDKPLPSGLPISCLCPMLAAVDQQHTIASHSAGREREQSILDVGWQRRGAHIEPELDGRRDLVDVLTARSGRAHEPLLDRAIVNRDVVGNANHAARHVVGHSVCS